MQAAWEVNPCPRAEDLWPSPAGRQEAKGANFLYIFAVFRPLGYWMRFLPHLSSRRGGWSSLPFTESIDSNANLISKHPPRHTQKSYWIWAHLGPVKLTYKINHHSGQMYFLILWCFSIILYSSWCIVSISQRNGEWINKVF